MVLRSIVARLAAMPMLVVATGFPVRACNLMPSRTPGASADFIPSKREPPPERVVIDRAPKVPLKPATFPEGVVIRSLDAVQTSLMRCYVRAREDDASLGSVKVVLHLEVSEYGAVTRAKADAIDARFAGCLALVARQMMFPTSGIATTLDLPLFFR